MDFLELFSKKTFKSFAVNKKVLFNLVNLTIINAIAPCLYTFIRCFIWCSCILASVEGTRPILVEVQALTSQTVFGLPKRTANGFDYNRLAVLIAVLEKKAGMMLGGQDIYLNVVGGLKINEPSIDLGILAATASSFKNIAISKDTVIMGEVGLTGEVRRINLIEKRIKEAEKLGFKKCIIPESNKKGLKEKYKLDIIGVKDINEAMNKLGLK